MLAIQRVVYAKTTLWRFLLRHVAKLEELLYSVHLHALPATMS